MCVLSPMSALLCLHSYVCTPMSVTTIHVVLCVCVESYVYTPMSALLCLHSYVCYYYTCSPMCGRGGSGGGTVLTFRSHSAKSLPDWARFVVVGVIVGGDCRRVVVGGWGRRSSRGGGGGDLVLPAEVVDGRGGRGG